MMPEIARIAEPKTLEELVYESLKKAIFSGQLPPGRRLKVAELGEQLGVSKMPVRTAIQRLAAESFVEWVPRRGAVVSGYNPEEIGEIYQVRVELEALAARLAAEQMTPEFLAELELLHQGIREATAAQDYAALSKANQAFHTALYKHSRNRWLTKFIADLWQRTRRSDGAYSHVVGHADNLLRDHEAIMEALRKGQPEECGRLMHEHISTARDGALHYAREFVLSKARE